MKIIKSNLERIEESSPDKWPEIEIQASLTVNIRIERNPEFMIDCTGGFPDGISPLLITVSAEYDGKKDSIKVSKLPLALLGALGCVNIEPIETLAEEIAGLLKRDVERRYRSSCKSLEDGMKRWNNKSSYEKTLERLDIFND